MEVDKEKPTFALAGKFGGKRQPRTHTLHVRDVRRLMSDQSFNKPFYTL